MNIQQMIQKIEETFSAIEYDYNVIGVRFEDKDREIGEECEFSRHNPDREDEREFPAFGSEEYEEMEELDGTSVWDIEWYIRDLKSQVRRGWINETDQATKHFATKHCYIVAGSRQGRHDDPDEGELLIKDSKVVAHIF